MNLNHKRRGAFTLLEVILASAIAVFLMVGLYIALDVQIRQAQAGREAVEKATLVRALFVRMSRDLSCSLTPLSAAKAAAAAPAATGTTGTTTATATTTDPEAELAIPLAAGVIGDDTTVAIFASKVAGSTDATDLDAGEDSGTPQPSDQRKISYFIGTVGDSTGLCRSEEKWTTSDAAQLSSSIDPDSENTIVIATEVQSMSLEYFDGTSWSNSWDGSTLGDDGVTPLGPPRAIRIHLWIKLGDAEAKEYRKTVSLLTGQLPPAAASTTPSTTTGGTTP
jgi:type II secretory pathway pseudopilin PulG